MKKSFLLFRDGRRLRAAHHELLKEDAPLLVNGRRFRPVGHFMHLSHITNAKKQLVGLVLDALENATTAPGWREWWDTFENRHLEDFWEAYLFLAEPMPAKWHHDCALLVTGGSIFADDAGDFILAIPDLNGFCFQPNQPTAFWTNFGFGLSKIEVKQESHKNDT